MARKAIINKEHSSVEELKKAINFLEKEKRALNKLYFINDIYHGLTVFDACEKLDISTTTGEKWLKNWNENGFGSLRRKRGSGAKSKLNSHEKELIERLINNNRFNSAKELQIFISNEFNIDYSLKQAERIFNFSKNKNLFSHNEDQ